MKLQREQNSEQEQTKTLWRLKGEHWQQQPQGDTISQPASYCLNVCVRPLACCSLKRQRKQRCQTHVAVVGKLQQCLSSCLTGCLWCRDLSCKSFQLQRRRRRRRRRQPQPQWRQASEQKQANKPAAQWHSTKRKAGRRPQATAA